MRIELNLVRAILLYLEAECHGQEISQIVLPEWSRDQVTYHIWYLSQAGYISARIDALPDCTDSIKQRLIYTIYGMSLIGYEFAEDARCLTQWAKLKAIAADMGIDGLGAMRKITAKYLA